MWVLWSILPSVLSSLVVLIELFAVTKWVMCTDCHHGTNVEPHWIRYSDIVRAIMTVGIDRDATVHCQRHDGPVYVRTIAPDIITGVIRYPTKGRLCGSQFPELVGFQDDSGYRDCCTGEDRGRWFWSSSQGSVAWLSRCYQAPAIQGARYLPPPI